MIKYYWTCPICGCNLDPGERCDCQDENIVDEKATTRPRMIVVSDSTSKGEKDDAKHRMAV